MVRASNGQELGDNELEAFRVTLVQGTDTVVVKPYMLAVLGDYDNNIDLCLEEKGNPFHVEADAGIAVDPREDVNSETKAEVLSR